MAPGTDQSTVSGVLVSQMGNGPRSFKEFKKLPPELRLQIWEEAVPLVPRILTYERKSHHATTFDINLFSRAQQNISQVCSESRQVFQEHQRKLNTSSQNEAFGLLAISPKRDIIQIGINFEIQHLEAFAASVGKEEAKEVRHLILEYQVENMYNGAGGVRRVTAPRFYKICELLPELTRIIFVSHKGDGGSNTLVGDLVFTSLDSTGTSEMDGITFKAWAEHSYPLFLERQLGARSMANRRPEILFMEPVEVSTLKN